MVGSKPAIAVLGSKTAVVGSKAAVVGSKAAVVESKIAVVKRKVAVVKIAVVESKIAVVDHTSAVVESGKSGRKICGALVAGMEVTMPTGPDVMINQIVALPCAVICWRRTLCAAHET